MKSFVDRSHSAAPDAVENEIDSKNEFAGLALAHSLRLKRSESADVSSKSSARRIDSVACSMEMLIHFGTLEKSVAFSSAGSGRSAGISSAGGDAIVARSGSLP